MWQIFIVYMGVEVVEEKKMVKNCPDFQKYNDTDINNDSNVSSLWSVLSNR